MELLRIERRPVANDRNLPNRYVLIGDVGSEIDVGPKNDPTKLDPTLGSSNDRNNSRKNSSQEPLKTPPSEIEQVFAHYVATMGKRGKAAELRADERKIIRDALAAAEVEELKTCITTCERSDYHMTRGVYAAGGSKARTGGKYNAIGKIFKPRPRYGETQRSRVEWWLDLAAEQASDAPGDSWQRFLEKDAR